MQRVPALARIAAFATLILATCVSSALGVPAILGEGFTWTTAPSANDHYDAACRVAGEVMVVGNDGVWRSDDGGGTWTVVTSAPAQGITFADTSHGWISGPTGLILHTDDGGSSWTTQTAPNPAALDSVRSVDTSHAWIPVLGQSDRVLYTHDGGANWVSSQVSTASAQMRGVSFADPLHGWAVGGSGVIAYSADGGVTWERQISGMTQNIYDVWAVNASNVWACGDGGKILHTTNGGQEWTTFNHPDGMSLNSIKFLSAREGWATSWNRVYHTADGGNTWETATTSSSRSVYGVAFAPGVRDTGYFPAWAGVLKLTMPTLEVAVTPPTHGTISPGSTDVAKWGDSPVFSFTPHYGYHLGEILADGETTTGPTCQFFNVTAPHTVAATFEPNSYSVAGEAGPHGSITPTQSQPFLFGTPSATFTVTPDSGYRVSDVSVNGHSVGTPTSYRIPSVSGDSTVSASFALAKIRVGITRNPASASKTFRRSHGYVKFTLGAVLVGARYHTAGQSITLQKSRNGRSWSTLARLTTNSSGKASKSIRVTKRSTTYYRWTIADTARHYSATSSKFKAVVR